MEKAALGPEDIRQAETLSTHPHSRYICFLTQKAGSESTSPCKSTRLNLGLDTEKGLHNIHSIPYSRILKTLTSIRHVIGP